MKVMVVINESIMIITKVPMTIQPTCTDTSRAPKKGMLAAAASPDVFSTLERIITSCVAHSDIPPGFASHCWVHCSVHCAVHSQDQAERRLNST
jgi:hypothetical protein